MPLLLRFLSGLDHNDGMWPLLALGILQVLVPLALTLRWLAVRRFAREISYMTASGRVSVNLQAIEEALTRAAVNLPGVKHVVVRVYEDRIRRQVIIQSVVSLWEDAQITASTQRCQDILSKRFQELMPEQRAVQVQVSINRLSQLRGSEFVRAVQEQSGAEEHEITPGLSVTAGEVSNAAGRALLAQTRRKRSDDGEIRERGETDYAHREAEQRRATRATEIDRSRRSQGPAADDELYHGPQYAVPDDDDQLDVTGEALPVDDR